MTCSEGGQSGNSPVNQTYFPRKDFFFSSLSFLWRPRRIDLEILAGGDHGIASDPEWQYKIEEPAARTLASWVASDKQEAPLISAEGRAERFYPKHCENHLLQERLTSLQFSEKADYRITVAFMLMRCRQLAFTFEKKKKKKKIKIPAHAPLWKYSLSRSATHPQTSWASRDLKVSEIKQF